MENEGYKLYCNHPLYEKDGFKRSIFQHVAWKTLAAESVYPDNYADLKLARAGIYQFYLQKIVADEQLQICRGSFLVDPFLKINKEKIELNDIILHTVLVKCLGPFEDWEKLLEVAHKCGYNLIHFTLVQELGKSNSSYSIFSPIIKPSILKI